MHSLFGSKTKGIFLFSLAYLQQDEFDHCCHDILHMRRRYSALCCCFVVLLSKHYLRLENIANSFLAIRLV